MDMSSTSTRTWTLALTAVASLMVTLDTLVVSTALSTIRLDLGASIEELEWTVNAYNLSFAVLLMTGSALGDRFGRRRVFTCGLALFATASAACGLAPGVGWLIAARAVQGAGGALVMPLALAIVSAAFPPQRRASALGIFFSVTGLATLGGPLVGGAIAEGTAWEWIFWVNVPIGLALIPLVLARVEESFGPDSALDVRGLALVTGAALGLVWGLVRGNAAGWGSLEVVATLGAGSLLALAFVAWELRAREPMLPMRLFRSRAFSAGNVATFCLLASILSAVFFLAQFLQTTLGYGPLAAGLRLVPWTAALLVVAPIAGALSDRFGARPFVVGGLALQAVGMGWIALIAEPGVAYSALVAPLIVAGCGASMAIPTVQGAVFAAVGAEAIGKAAGTNNMMAQLGGVFGIAIAVAVFAAAGSYASAGAFADGFAPAMGVAAALAVAGALAGVWVPTRRAARAAALSEPVGALDG
jgi:EmrB/QacA subfamily drug resistance transporter